MRAHHFVGVAVVLTALGAACAATSSVETKEPKRDVGEPHAAQPSAKGSGKSEDPAEKGSDKSAEPEDTGRKSTKNTCEEGSGMGGAAPECWEQERDLYAHIRVGGTVLTASEPDADKDDKGFKTWGWYVRGSFGTAVGAQSGLRIGLDGAYISGRIPAPQGTPRGGKNPTKGFHLVQLGPGLHRAFDAPWGHGQGLMLSVTPSLMITNFRDTAVEGTTFREFGYGGSLGLGWLIPVLRRTQSACSWGACPPWNAMGVIFVGIDPTFAVVEQRSYFFFPFSVGLSL